MAENERTIVPGTWSDVFAGLSTQGLGRLRVQIVDEEGNPVTEALPLPVADPRTLQTAIIDENRSTQLLSSIDINIKKLLILMNEGMDEEI